MNFLSGENLSSVFYGWYRNIIIILMPQDMSRMFPYKGVLIYNLIEVYQYNKRFKTDINIWIYSRTRLVRTPPGSGKKYVLTELMLHRNLYHK